MIDAGSTGSRIRVYNFHSCLASPTFKDEVSLQTYPGLSSFAKEPLEAAKSLDVIKQAKHIVLKKLGGVHL